MKKLAQNESGKIRTYRPEINLISRAGFAFPMWKGILT